jgi:GNAT superfamily N-acetyltransferase
MGQSGPEISPNVLLMNIPQNIKLKTMYSSKGEGGTILHVAFQIFEGPQPIGKVSLYHIKAKEARYSLCSTCDEYGETLHCGEAVYDFRTDEYSQNVEHLFEPLGSPIDLDVLYIDQMEIDPAYRGKGIGLLVLLKVIRRYQDQCGLVAIKPYPLQHAANNIPESSKEFKRDRKKLVQYYARLGFERIPNTDYHALSLEYELPTEKELFALMPSAPAKHRP